MTHQNAVIPLTRGSSFTLSDLADHYMACYRGRDGACGQRLSFFVSRLGNKIAHDIDSDDIADALDDLTRRGSLRNNGGQIKGGNIVPTGKPLAPSTLNRYRCVIQAVLTFARKKRLMPKGWTNPVNDTERQPEDNARTRYLTQPEYERLLKCARVSYWNKLQLLIKLAVTTGARRGTLLGLRWSDVDLEAGRAFCERTKNGESFVMVLLPDVVADLKRVKGSSQADDLIFCGRYPSKPAQFTRAWKNAVANAGLESDVCFHSLRHTHASWLAKSGAPLLAIADSLGHKSLAMTKRYSHLCIDSRSEMINKVFAA
jgi:integrase